MLEKRSRAEKLAASGRHGYGRPGYLVLSFLMYAALRSRC